MGRLDMHTLQEFVRLARMGKGSGQSRGCYRSARTPNASIASYLRLRDCWSAIQTTCPRYPGRDGPGQVAQVDFGDVGKLYDLRPAGRGPAAGLRADRVRSEHRDVDTRRPVARRAARRGGRDPGRDGARSGRAGRRPAAI